MLALLANRRFLALYLSQIATQVGANALLYALTIEITARTAGSATAVGATDCVRSIASSRCCRSADRKSTRLNSSHVSESRMPSSA